MLRSICCLTITFFGCRIVGPKFAFYQFLTFFLTTGYIIDVLHFINKITNIISCQKTLTMNWSYWADRTCRTVVLTCLDRRTWWWGYNRRTGNRCWTFWTITWVTMAWVAITWVTMTWFTKKEPLINIEWSKYWSRSWSKWWWKWWSKWCK